MTVSFEIQGELIKPVFGMVSEIQDDFLGLLKMPFSWFYRKIDDTFEAQGARDGHDKWQPLSDMTTALRLVKRGGAYGTKKKYGKSTLITKQMLMAEKRNMAILQDTGQLKRSFRVIRSDDDSVTFGSTLEYAAKHQFGDPTNTFEGESAPIPQREMLFVTANDREELLDLLNRTLSRVINK